MSQLLKSINPANGELIKSYEIDTAAELQYKIDNSHHAFLRWKTNTVRQRCTYLQMLADYLTKHKKSIAEMATLEMGKPFAQSVAEVEKCSVALAYYAKNGEKYLESEIVKTDAQKSFVTFQPLGVVLAIMPWNFPYWQVFRAMGPILIAGNSMLLKHASNVTACAIAIEEAVKRAGLPDHLFQALLAPSSEMEQVIAHKHIQAVTFTGSTSAGAAVASTAAKYIKKQVLELGGSDAYLILEDADLKLAAAVCVNSRLTNSGQSCIAAKRFIVDKKVLPEFTGEMVAEMKKRKFGDPMDLSVHLGPMARVDLRDDLHGQVQKSIAQGAQLLCGGYVPENAGAFYPPTVLAGVKKGMPAYDEEMFGPVAAIIEAQDTADAIRTANDSDFGLGAAIFSRNIKKAEKIAEEQLEAGSVFVNELVSSNPKLPFGGIKQSGYGRELSYFAIHEFSNIKTIFVR